jgi:hypothetical protein
MTVAGAKAHEARQLAAVLPVSTQFTAVGPEAGSAEAGSAEAESVVVGSLSNTPNAQRVENIIITAAATATHILFCFNSSVRDKSSSRDIYIFKNKINIIQLRNCKTI